MKQFADITLSWSGEEEIKKLIDIRDRHLNCFEEYEDTVKSSSYRLMSKSKNSSLYGMYMSDESLIKYFWEKGLKLTKNESEKDFVYYFDDKDRLLLSERYNGNGGKLLSWNFFYYYENYTEIVKYSPEDKRLFRVALISYKDGILDGFLESGYVRTGEIYHYIEYLFNVIPDAVVRNYYYYGPKSYYGPKNYYDTKSYYSSKSSYLLAKLH